MPGPLTPDRDLLGQGSPCFTMCGRALCQRFGCLHATSETAIVERYEDLRAEVDRLRAALTRLASKEGFCGALDAERSTRDALWAELRARGTFAFDQINPAPVRDAGALSVEATPPTKGTESSACSP